jgi:hypothetical protein
MLQFFELSQPAIQFFFFFCKLVHGGPANLFGHLFASFFYILGLVVVGGNFHQPCGLDFNDLSHEFLCGEDQFMIPLWDQKYKR